MSSPDQLVTTCNSPWHPSFGLKAFQPLVIWGPTWENIAEMSAPIGSLWSSTAAALTGIHLLWNLPHARRETCWAICFRADTWELDYLPTPLPPIQGPILPGTEYLLPHTGRHAFHPSLTAVGILPFYWGEGTLCSSWTGLLLKPTSSPSWYAVTHVMSHEVTLC